LFYSKSKMKIKQKKGVIFSLDAFMAVGIFLIAAVSIYVFVLSSGNLKQQYYISNDILNIMQDIKVYELSATKYPELAIVLINNGSVSSKYLGSAFMTTDKAGIFFNAIFKILLSDKYEFGLNIDNKEISITNKNFVVARRARFTEG